MEDSFVLASILTQEQIDRGGTHLYAILSVIAESDPFPGQKLPTMVDATTGDAAPAPQAVGEMFWAKTYSENKGIIEELEHAGWLAR